MEEQWKSFEPPFDDYLISNFGRIKNKKGKEIKAYKQCDRGYEYAKVAINIRRKGLSARKNTSLAVEVYKAFGEKYVNGAMIYHKDGDIWNCRIDNLFISKGYVEPPTREQVEKYENEVLHCIKHIIKTEKYNDYADLIDVDNIIGESYLQIWKHLSQYKIETSFYAFCKRYVKWAFLVEWKKKKIEQEYIKKLMGVK